MKATKRRSTAITERSQEKTNVFLMLLFSLCLGRSLQHRVATPPLPRGAWAWVWVCGLGCGMYSPKPSKTKRAKNDNYNSSVLSMLHPVLSECDGIFSLCRSPLPTLVFLKHSLRHELGRSSIIRTIKPKKKKKTVYAVVRR